jgi:hypothetical protein
MPKVIIQLITNMNISKGLRNLFASTINNIIIALCLIIILILVYLKTKKIDLFGIDDPTEGRPTSSLNNNDYLSTFINKYVNKIQQQNNYKTVLATQQQTIQNLTQKVSNLINPPT